MRCSSTCLGLVILFRAWAQDPAPEQVSEELFPVPDTESIEPARIDEYFSRIQQPLDLNTASEEELRALHVFTDRDISAILAHRSFTGPFLSVYELQVVGGLTENVIRQALPFITVRDPESGSWAGLFRRPEEGHVLIRCESVLNRQEGYRRQSGSGPPFAGLPVNRYFRIRARSSSGFHYGLATELDAGERFTWNPQRHRYGTDFISGFVAVRDKGRVQNLVIGNFRAAFGQGLVMGGGFSVGKGAESVVTVRKAATGFSPYTSASESGFLRGAGLSLSPVRHITWHVFVSGVRRDGSLFAGPDGSVYLRSVQSSGLHRTISEQRHRRTWSEHLAGTALEYRRGSFSAGILAQHRQLSRPLRRGEEVYQRFDFNGKQDRQVSAFVNGQVGPFTLFSEFARSTGGSDGRAAIAGALIAPAPSFESAWVLRSYSTGYHAVFSNALAERSETQNEQGLYFGWKYKHSRKNELSGYADWFRFPGLQYRCYRPSSGSEWMVRHLLRMNRKTHMYVQVRREDKLRNLPDDGQPFYSASRIVRMNYVWHGEHPLSERVTVRLRMQINTVRHGARSEHGFLTAFDVLARWRKWQVAWRYGLFDAVDADVRMYAFERDVWSAFSFTSLSGTGARTGVVIGYRIDRHWDVWCRTVLTRFDDRDDVGYGWEMSDGPMRAEVKLQLRYRW